MKKLSSDFRILHSSKIATLRKKRCTDCLNVLPQSIRMFRGSADSIPYWSSMLTLPRQFCKQHHQHVTKRDTQEKSHNALRTQKYVADQVTLLLGFPNASMQTLQGVGLAVRQCRYGVHVELPVPRNTARVFIAGAKYLLAFRTI